MMASEKEVRGKQLLLMLDKAAKHFRLANHWLDRARKEFPKVENKK